MRSVSPTLVLAIFLTTASATKAEVRGQRACGIQLVMAELLRRPATTQLEGLRLGRRGQYAEALAIDRTMEARLRDQPVRSITRLAGISDVGRTQPRIVTLADGTRALFKPFHETVHRPGVGRAVYEIERALRLFRSPTIIERTIPELGPGTLQIFIEGARHDRPRGRQVAGVDPELQLFDYLIGNTDRVRNGKNQLRHDELEVSVAVDSDSALEVQHPALGGPGLSELAELVHDNPSLVARILDLRLEQLAAIGARNGLDPRSMQRVLERRQRILRLAE